MNILLVNKAHPIPQDYSTELVEIPGFAPEQGAACCVPSLMQMLDDCRNAGLQPIVISAWRSNSQQLEILRCSIETRINAGMTAEEAEKNALMQVALPGLSEHQTGLAFDITDGSDRNNLTDGQEEKPAQQWLMNHCWEYGFILRYPKGKEPITGYCYEPWHYRYVGTQISLSIKASGMCLEEYLEK